MNKDLNYYKILEVTWESDKKDIKTSYRNLSKKHHPDKNGGDDTEFTKIAEAYKVLTNDKLREEYDTKSRFGKTYDEALELYNFEFSNENVSTEKYQQDVKKFKKKELVDILIKMKEFTNEVEYDRYVSCKTCDGSGMNFDDHLYVFECDLCDGSGEWKNDTCPSCKGKGESSMKKCDTCNGEKVFEVTEKVKLDKEKFFEDKCKIEFKGNASRHEVGKVGNLYVIIEGESDSDN